MIQKLVIVLEQAGVTTQQIVTIEDSGQPSLNGCRFDETARVDLDLSGQTAFMALVASNLVGLVAAIVSGQAQAEAKPAIMVARAGR